MVDYWSRNYLEFNKDYSLTNDPEIRIMTSSCAQLQLCVRGEREVLNYYESTTIGNLF